MRRFEFKDSSSNKFWEISVEGNSTLVRFGAIGTKGQEKTKEYASAELAEKAAAKLIKEKSAKGYVEANDTSKAPTKPTDSKPEKQAPALATTSKSPSAEHRDLAEKLRTAKSPEKLLRKAAPKGKWASLLWELAAEGLVSPLPDLVTGKDLTWEFKESAAEAPWEHVKTALSLLDEQEFACSSVRDYGNNYAKNQGSWDEAFPSLPACARYVIAFAKKQSRKQVPAEVIEAALNVLAESTVVGKGDSQEYAARDLGEEKEVFLRRIAALLPSFSPDSTAKNGLIVDALAFAPWDRVVAFQKKNPDTDITKTLLARNDPVLDVLELLATQSTGYDYLKALIPLAARQKVTLPESVDKAIVQALVAGVDQEDFLEGLGMIPASRLAPIFRQAVEESEHCASQSAFSLLRYLNDEESRQAAEKALKLAIDEDNLFHLVEALGRAGNVGIELLQHAHGQLKNNRSSQGARWRTELRRGLFLAACHAAPRDIESLLPDEDLIYLNTLRDLVGDEEQAEKILALLSEAEQHQVQQAWARADWNATLDSERWGIQPIALDEESAPWEELEQALKSTSLSRLSASDALSRDDVPLESRREVVEELLSRADREDHTEVISRIAFDFRDLGEEHFSPGSTWDRLFQAGLYSLMSSTELDWYAAMPRAAVRRWADELKDSESMADIREELLARIGETSKQKWTAEHAMKTTEDPIVHLKQLLSNSGHACNKTIYVLKRLEQPGPSPSARIAALPLGIEDSDLPSWDGQPMQHVITLDFGLMPAMREHAGFDSDVAGLAVFISSLEMNEAHERDSGQTAALALSVEQLSQGHESEGGAWYDVEAIDVPSAVFDEKAVQEDSNLEALYDAIFRLEARALGTPIWIQSESDEDDEEDFLIQFEDRFVPDLNCGDGTFYIFVDDAFWEC